VAERFLPRNRNPVPKPNPALGRFNVKVAAKLRPTREPLIIFIEQCVWTWCLFSQLKALCVLDKKDRNIVCRYAKQFVGEMQTVLRHYVILRICMLIEKPRWKNTSGAWRENLTIDNLIETLPLPMDTRDSLNRKSRKLKETVKPLMKARNRIIAHLDKENAMWNRGLGALPSGAYEEFFDQLEGILNELCEAVRPDPKKDPTVRSFKVAMAADPVTEMVVNLRSIQNRS
jgi:hypothetical protein